MNLCEICKNKSKYTCPKCQIKTCSINCSNNHKCDNQIEFKQNFNKNNLNDNINILLNDCKLLDKISNKLESTSRFLVNPIINTNNKYKKYKKVIKKYCNNHKINLNYSPLILKRNKLNKSVYKDNRVHWTVEFNFLKSKVNFIDHNVNDNLTLNECYELLMTNLTKSKNYNNIAKQYKNTNNILILLKQVPRKSNENKYFKCNLTQTILENLVNGNVLDDILLCLTNYPKVNDKLQFPTFYVILKEDEKEFEIVDKVNSEFRDDSEKDGDLCESVKDSKD